MVYYVIIRAGYRRSGIAEKLARAIHGEYLLVDKITKDAGMNKFFHNTNSPDIAELLTTTAKSFLVKGVPVVFDGDFNLNSEVEDLVKRLPYFHYVFDVRSRLEVE